MRREYIDSMRSKGFGEFVSACEDLKNCKYVLAENKISAILKAVADNKQLYSMFGAALYGFDYKNTFSSCVSDNGFTLPNDPQTAIALVFRMFIDIDSGKMPLQNILEAYFYGDSLNESYARFVLEIVSPFLTYCRMYFIKADSASQEFMSQQDELMAQAYDDMSNRVQSDLKSDAVACVDKLLKIAESAITGIIDRAEYEACLKGLLRCLKSYDTEDVIASFLGVKYAVAYFFKGNAAVTEIYKKLEYDIKHITD